MSSLVIASNGCFVNKGSSKYCTDLSHVEAQEECSFSDTCDLNSDFLEGQSCNFVEDCRQILCKSSCKVEFAGLCAFGEVPQGNEQEWCSSGCCQFTYGVEGNQEYCQSTPGQWKCEVEAINRDQISYGFESNSHCEMSCQDFSYQATSHPVSVTKKQFTTILLEESKKPKSAVQKEVYLPKEVVSEEKTGSEFSFFWWILLIGVVVFVIIKWSSWFKPRDEDFTEEMVPSKSFNFLSPFISNPFTTLRIKKMKREHQHKRKEQRMDNLFGEVGLKLPEEIKPSQNFEELEQRIKQTKIHIKTTSVIKLNQIAKQRDMKEKNTFNTLKEHQKQEQMDLFRKLRKISQKNK
ncbi:hypothetical protein COV12_03410 [Candidatus Woesearchaeota archaeon CG10_big_fil_rev_8_21_14_0_10_32_24]|nr:MAG: hypothetical protein COV12_03410 [Candidatus Woesearchaeota archaeon CG10_big_fil_rev_8_21_14_0_10_32_24]